MTDGVDLSGAKNLGERLAAITPYLTLNNRILIPIIGLSAGKFDDLKDKNALETALGLGYRLIDTDGGEEAAAAAFEASGLGRGQLFIQSSLEAQNGDESGMLALRGAFCSGFTVRDLRRRSAFAITLENLRPKI